MWMLSYSCDAGRIQFVSATDREAANALKLLSQVEGIIPALESAHAIAEAIRLAPRVKKSGLIIINLSGRGDKDMGTVAEYFKKGVGSLGS